MAFSLPEESSEQSRVRHEDSRGLLKVIVFWRSRPRARGICIKLRFQARQLAGHVEVFPLLERIRQQRGNLFSCGRRSPGSGIGTGPGTSTSTRLLMRCSIGAKKRSKQSLREKPAITGGLELPSGIEQRCTSNNVFQPANGAYQIVINGLKYGTFTLSSQVFSQDGSPQARLTATGIMGPGSSTAFSIQLNSTPGAQWPIVVVATFKSTLADISNGLQLGLIDNQGVANSLPQKIQARFAPPQ
jgi:hypothetical protein